MMTTKELIRMWGFVLAGVVVSVTLAFSTWTLVMVNARVGIL